MPENADLLDVRYNVIQWVHRSSRGWSYGTGVMDPRTGEIIKGHVSLGSLHVRQDFLIAAGLLSPYEDGAAVPPEMEQMALARLRQLAAQEVGHTLGLMHNFAASVLDRASVMDYPHPQVRIKADGSLDLSNAYAADIGEWDKVAIAYGYQHFPAGVNEAGPLQKILRKSIADGFIFISDQDARPAGGAHPLAHLWDNGVNAADELNHVMKIRRIALNNFSEKNIRSGTDNVVLHHLMSLAANENTANQVRAIAAHKLEELRTWLFARSGVIKDESQIAHVLFAIREILRFQKDPQKMNLTKPVGPPAGSPIGTRKEFCGFSGRF